MDMTRGLSKVLLKHELRQKVNLVISGIYLWGTESMPVPVLGGKVMEMNKMKLSSSRNLPSPESCSWVAGIEL